MESYEHFWYGFCFYKAGNILQQIIERLIHIDFQNHIHDQNFIINGKDSFLV